MIVSSELSIDKSSGNGSCCPLRNNSNQERENKKQNALTDKLIQSRKAQTLTRMGNFEKEDIVRPKTGCIGEKTFGPDNVTVVCLSIIASLDLPLSYNVKAVFYLV